MAGGEPLFPGGFGLCFVQFEKKRISLQKKKTTQLKCITNPHTVRRKGPRTGGTHGEMKRNRAIHRDKRGEWT